MTPDRERTGSYRDISRPEHRNRQHCPPEGRTDSQGPAGESRRTSDIRH